MAYGLKLELKLEFVVSNKNVMMLSLKLIGSIRIRITRAIYNGVDKPIVLQYVNRKFN